MCGGIWCIVQLEYVFNEQDKHTNPIKIAKLTPIQMPHVDIHDLKEGRKSSSKATQSHKPTNPTVRLLIL